MVTKQEIEAAQTPAGGWTKQQLTEWGVPWPPPRGWKRKLLENEMAKNEDTTVTLGPNAGSEEEALLPDGQRLVIEVTRRCPNLSKANLLELVGQLHERYGDPETALRAVLNGMVDFDRVH